MGCIGVALGLVVQRRQRGGRVLHWAGYGTARGRGDRQDEPCTTTPRLLSHSGTMLPRRPRGCPRRALLPPTRLDRPPHACHAHAAAKTGHSMLTRPPLAPGAVPERLSGLCCLPQSKVAGVPLLARGIRSLPCGDSGRTYGPQPSAQLQAGKEAAGAACCRAETRELRSARLARMSQRRHGRPPASAAAPTAQGLSLPYVWPPALRHIGSEVCVCLLNLPSLLHQNKQPHLLPC